MNKETDFIVIDNGTPNIQELIESIQVYERCIELRQLKENLGLARALNIGIEQARSLGCDYVFLFDQDSSLCDKFVNRMISACHDALRLSANGVAAVGPRIINPQTNRQTPFKLFNRFILRTDRPFNGSNSHFQADFLITSGTLLVLEHLQQIGDMKESYFIDNVDLEWCFRAKSLGFDLVGTDGAVLYHAIGERSDNPLVRAGFMAQHNPPAPIIPAAIGHISIGEAIRPWAGSCVIASDSLSKRAGLSSVRRIADFTGRAFVPESATRSR